MSLALATTALIATAYVLLSVAFATTASDFNFTLLARDVLRYVYDAFGVALQRVNFNRGVYPLATVTTAGGVALQSGTNAAIEAAQNVLLGATADALTAAVGAMTLLVAGGPAKSTIWGPMAGFVVDASTTQTFPQAQIPEPEVCEAACTLWTWVHKSVRP